LVDTLVNFIEQFGAFSYFISILVNVILNIAAVIPTAFMTTINIVLFDLKVGILITFIGEMVGTVISFYLYRLGLRKIQFLVKNENKWVEKIRSSEGKEAFFYILIGRLAPVIPSSVVTIAAAFSQIKIGLFTIATILGKIPALALEVLLVLGFLQLESSNQIMILLLIIIIFIWRKMKK